MTTAQVNLKNHKTTKIGPEAVYIDRNGNECKVYGSFAFVPFLSWVNEKGDYMIMCGHDQGRSAITGSVI